MLLFVINAVAVTCGDWREAKRTDLQSGVALPHSQPSSDLSSPSSPTRTSLGGDDSQIEGMILSRSRGSGYGGCSEAVPSLHMRCRMTASLRASATLARFKPRRCASLIAQLLRLDHLADRVSRTWAASNSAPRTEASPTRLMQPSLSVSPDWYLRGVLATAPFCRPPV